jgi:aspartyl/asparaginyl beta-hydroxylase (cupin superfamily)
MSNQDFAEEVGDEASLEQRARDAAAQGQTDRAQTLWKTLAARQPTHFEALSALGTQALREGASANARTLFARAAEAHPDKVTGWINLALACRRLNDNDGEMAAIVSALDLDPYQIFALVMKAQLYERTNDTSAAAEVWAGVLKIAPPAEQTPPNLRPVLAHARSFLDARAAEREAFFRKLLDPALDADREGAERFSETVDIFLNDKPKYRSEPLHFYFHRLSPQYFFERRLFPWIEALEAATDDIRAEALKALERNEGLEPYVAYPPGVPLNQWKELNHSAKWNAFHLYSNGSPVEDHCAACPKTMQMMRAIPQPVMPGRSPNAMFSLLAPRTHIPPHTGVSNARLVVHLPLIVPDGCRFRVGSDTRQVREGKAWVFDDTVEHEAWNDSDQLRVVLIFDIWHPDLSPLEQGLVARFMAGLDAFNAETPRYDL